MSEIRFGGKPSDIVIEIGDRTFNCHRDALTSVSGYFRDRLNDGLPEEGSKIVLPEEDISADAFEYALPSFYKEMHCVQLTLENLDHLLTAADFLQLSNLRMDLPVSFMLDTMTAARRKGRECLWHYMADSLSLQLGDLYETTEFLELPLEDIKLIIEMSPLNGKIVEEAVIYWIDHKREERWRHFNELSRLGVMTGFSSSKIKSTAIESIVPEGIPQEEVQYFLNNLRSTSNDKDLIVFWGLPIDEPSPRKGPCVVSAFINESLTSVMIPMIDTRIAGMKRVVFEKSYIYQLNFTLLDACFSTRGRFEFFSYTHPNELKAKPLTSPSKRALRASRYAHFYMCGLRSTKRIYLCAKAAKDLYVYDCDSNKWETLYFSKALEWATMTACDTNNAVYLLGGDEHNGAYLFALDPSTEEWSDLSQASAEKYTVGTAMCAFNGKLYIYHETYRAYGIYDPQTNEWAYSCENPYANTPPLENVVVYCDELWLFSAAPKRLTEERKKKAHMAYVYRPESNSWRAYSPLTPTIKMYEEAALCTGFDFLDAIELPM